MFGLCTPSALPLYRGGPDSVSSLIVLKSPRKSILPNSRGFGKGEDPIDVEVKFREIIGKSGNNSNGYKPNTSNESAGSSFGFEESGYRDLGDENSYNKDPEFADILGSFLSDPQKGQSKMEERLRMKRNKIIHNKTGSPTPMKVTFNKFNFSNAYIWFEFYNTLLEKDVSLICDTIRSWHIIGRLGGCNSMNMQLSQTTSEKRPNYDYIQGANVTQTTFYNIGDLEIQENLARIWVDIGTREPLLLDVLVNALSQISSDFVGIKQVVFGGKEFDGWNESLKSEDTGYVTVKI